MKLSRFSDEQIIHLLQQAERGEQPIGVLSREHGISEQLPCPRSGTKMDENGAGLASVAYRR
jgi:hypothetical protein